MTASAVPLSAESAKANGAAGAIRALIVEDEPADAKLVERVLNRLESYRVNTLVVGDIKSAQAAAARERFDVAFIDYDLGGHCGVDLVPELAENGACVSVLLTGRLTPKVHERALAAGVLASLSKDRLDVDAVEVALRQALRMRDLAVETMRRTQTKLARRSELKGLAAALPTHLMPALRLLQARTENLEHAIESGKPEGSTLSDIRMMRYIIGDLTAYCQDTINILSKHEDEMHDAQSIDVQSVLLDVLNIVYAERRRRAVRFQLDLHDLPLAVRASPSVLRFALVDMLSVALQRTMPGSRIRVAIAVEHGGITIALTSNDVIAGTSEVRVNVERLAARCRALLNQLGGHAVLFEKPRTDGHIGTVWLPLAGHTLKWGDGAAQLQPAEQDVPHPRKKGSGKGMV